MHKRSRKEEVAAFFAKGSGCSQTTPGSTPPTPGSVAANKSSSSPPIRAEWETANTTTSPSTVPNLSSLVSAAQPGADSSDTEDGPQDPTSIIGAPATAAAFVDRVANIYRLDKGNCASLHAFNKV